MVNLMRGSQVNLIRGSQRPVSSTRSYCHCCLEEKRPQPPGTGSRERCTRAEYGGVVEVPLACQISAPQQPVGMLADLAHSYEYATTRYDVALIVGLGPGYWS